MENKIKILIVDDDEWMMRALHEILSGDYMLEMAEDGLQAIERMKSFNPDIVLMDVLMPGIDGLEVCRRIRRNPHFRFVKIMLISSSSETQERIQGYTAGADDYISKPFNRDEVEAKVRVFSKLKSVEESDQALRIEREEQQELIVKLREVKNQLLQSDKMASIGQLAAGVAHEINNPIGYVGSNLLILQDYIKEIFILLDTYETVEHLLDSEGENRRALEEIRELKVRMKVDYLRKDIFELLQESTDGTNRVRKIVQDLKEFSHSDIEEWEYADLHKGLDSTLNIVNNEIKYKAEVVKEYGVLPPVECLAPQINQVFMNLLVNAAHSIEEHGKIILRTGCINDQVWVSISDTGGGIDPEHINKIFDPFFTTKPVGKGTGLGLSLSYGIISKHGGRINVESEVDKGTTFTVWLPIEQVEKQIEATG